MKRVFLGGLMALGLSVSGCITTVPNPDDNVRAQAWYQVNNITDLTDLGGNRLRISASTAPGYNIEQLETDLLTRASGEAVRRGAPRFAIVYLDYEDSGVGRLFMGSGYNDGTRSWIGAYEDLLIARTEADPDGSLSRNLNFKQVTAVVRLLADGEVPDRQAFRAEDTYVSLLNDRITRRGIKPQRRVTLRRN